MEEKPIKPTIELLELVKGSTFILDSHLTEVLFCLEGSLVYSFPNLKEGKLEEGEMILFPAGRKSCLHVLSAGSLILIMRLNYPPLFTSVSKERSAHLIHTIGNARIKPVIGRYLAILIECIGDGLQCEIYFDIKVREFYELLKIYYSENELFLLFAPLSNRNQSFSEAVRRHWKVRCNVKELSAVLHMTPKQFSRKFVAVFGMTPYRWIKEMRAEAIYHKIITSDDAFKYIADELGFSNVQHFTRFAKAELGRTPSEIRRSKEKGIIDK